MASTSATLGTLRAEPDTDLEIERLIASRGVESAFQPIVDLYGGQTVGFEALARGPRGSTIEAPAGLFAAAARAGRERELEWECQRAAMQGALDAGLGPRQALFINAEPRLLGPSLPAHVLEVGERAQARFPLFVEFTERSLTDRPAELLAAAGMLRARGAGIALDDVGADPRSLALMPVLAPDVIKLDLSLVQEQPSRQIAAIVHAVNAEAERTGAQVLAEGIECEEHRHTALALGARFGQGFLFGRPGTLRASAPAPSAVALLQAGVQRASTDSPFELVRRRHEPRRGTKRLLLALSRQIEAQAGSLGNTALVLSNFQEASFFTPATAARYSELGARAALVGALGVGLPERPAPGVRGVSLDRHDPLRGEWDVVVIGAHFAAAFVARDLGDGDRADMERRFDFAMTYERSLAVEVAAALIGRLAPLSDSTPG